MCDIYGIYYFDQRGCRIFGSKKDIGLNNKNRESRKVIHNEDNSVFIVCNGEIYNLLETKTFLVERGHKFYTSTDSEIIIHLYEDFGPDCVDKLDGTFAFAIWDRNKESLLMARDGIGIKPLYYSILTDKIIFASQIKAILQYPGIKREVSLKSLSEYLTFEYIPAPNTIFSNIKKLLPGHILFCKNGTAKISKYWDISFNSTNSFLKERHYSETICELLKNSVKKRLKDNTPLGIFLSSGIDSSSILSCAKEISEDPLKTFSIGFGEKSFDESRDARLIAKHFGTEHHELVIKPEMVRRLLPELMQLIDEPLADASIIPTYFVSNLARSQVAIALSGDGGDELFGGYNTYQAYRIAHYYRKIPGFIRERLIKSVVNLFPPSYKNLSFDIKAKKFVSGIKFPPEICNYVWWGAYTPEKKAELFLPDLFSLIRREDSFYPIRLHLQNCSSLNELNRIFYLDIKLNLQDGSLVKAEWASRANSLKVRFPFLDRRLIEFAISIPSNLKLKGLTTKYILRKSMEKRLSPLAIRKGKKGFDVPIGKWMRKELKDFVLDALSETRVKKMGYFDYQFIKRILKEHFEGRHNHRQLIWPLVVFGEWHRNYIEGGFKKL